MIEVFALTMLASRFALCTILAARAGYVWARPVRAGLPLAASLALAHRARLWAGIGVLGAATQAIRLGHPPDLVTIPDAFGTAFLAVVVLVGLDQLKARP